MSTKFREIGGNFGPSIDIDTLIVGSRIPFDISVKEGGITRQLLNKGALITNETKEILKEKGISKLNVSGADVSDVESYLKKAKINKESLYEKDEIALKEYSFKKEHHYHIDRSILIPGTEAPFSFYLLSGLDLIPLAEGNEKKPALINENILNAKGDIVIDNSDIPLLNEYVQHLSSLDTIPKQMKEKVKAMSIRENSKILIKNILDDPRSGEKIKKTKEEVNKMTECILNNPDAIYDMLSLRNYDYYTYTHCVNVSVLSVGLGVAIGLKKDEIEKLGTGALLHDIGKSAIPPEVLNKQGKLTDTEYSIIKNHVIEGQNLLLQNKEVHPESLPAVVQHHEKLTGKGYPYGISGNQVVLFGRITAIADCYDALTTQRPYKTAFTPFHAISLVAKDSGDYDAALLKEFVKMLGKIK
jgi:putative nucleotidyltransferase with HDIG domain